MIDKFQRVAQAIQILRIPAILLGALFLGLIAASLLGIGSNQLGQYLEPCFIGLIWALATYAFVATFEEIPAPADRTDGLATKIRRKLSRARYWLIALAFVGTTVLALMITSRLLSDWLQG